MNRREAREQAFILLFEQSLNHDGMEQIIETAELCGEGAYMVDAFAERLALRAEEKQAELDEKIEKNIRGWKMNRLSKVSLAVLRLALCEMFWEADIPVSVSINEAVEIAKKYGGKEDAPFVNGVLGSVAKELAQVGEETGKNPVEAGETGEEPPARPEAAGAEQAFATEKSAEPNV